MHVHYSQPMYIRHFRICGLETAGFLFASREQRDSVPPFMYAHVASQQGRVAGAVEPSYNSKQHGTAVQ